MATRFYPTVKAPNAIIHGPCRGPWEAVSVFARSWAPIQWHWVMDTSKVDGGDLTSFQINCNQQGDFDFHFLNFMTKPLEAQTISGTFDLCFMVAQSWLDAVDPPTDQSVVRWRVYAYIAEGQTTAVRHVLLDYVDSQDFPFPVIEGLALASAQTLTAGNALEGDTIRLEIGFRIVSSPTPDATQPPTNMTQIMFQGLGTDSGAGDLTTGETASLNAWMEFSADLSFLPDPDPPANDACEDAIDAGTGRYQSDYIDTTQSQDSNRAVWWKWVAPSTGSVCAHAFGSNYGVRIDAFTDGCGTLNNVFFPNRQTYLSMHRSQASTVWNAEEGVEYWIRASNTASTFNAPNGGGMCRIGIFMREVPTEDDLFLPSQTVGVFREGLMTNLSAAFAGQNTSGIALDYTGTPMDDLNGGTHEGVRALLGLFSSDLVEILDGEDLSYGGFQSEIDFIGDPWDSNINRHPSTLYVTAAGQLFTAFFGTGFEYVAGLGELPSLMNVLSDDLTNGYIRELAATNGDTQSSAPFTATVHPAEAETTAPWAITMDEENGAIYFTSGSFYGFVGGTEVRKYDIDTQLTTVFATIPTRPGNNPGIKGLQFLPGGGLLVCNGDCVHRLDATGTIISTYVPSVAEDSQELVDVKLTADGEAFWTVDLGTVRLFKVDIATMEEIATYNTYLESGTLTQMAIFQPTPPPIPPTEPPVEPPEPPVEDCPADIPFTPPPRNPLEKFFRVHAPKTIRGARATADAQFNDIGASLGDVGFGALSLGGFGVRRKPGLDEGV